MLSAVHFDNQPRSMAGEVDDILTNGNLTAEVPVRFMERGRTNHLRLLGAGHRSLFEEAQQEAPGFAFVVRSMQIEFLKPARMDDVLEVTTAPEEVKGASITLHQRIARGEDLLVEAHVRVAFVCGGRVRPIPKALRVAMRAGEGLIGS